MLIAIHDASFRVPTLPLSFAEEILRSDDPDTLALNYFRENSLIRLAILAASPSLYASILNTNADSKKKRRASQKLIRYIVRMSTRTTPFAFFSAVGLFSFGPVTDISFSVESCSPSTQPDFGRLTALLRTYSGSEHLVESENLRWNETAFEKGGRLFYERPRGQSGHTTGNSSNSIRITPIIPLIRDRCRLEDGVSYQALLSFLTIERGLDVEKSSKMLAALHSSGVILTSRVLKTIGDSFTTALRDIAKVDPLTATSLGPLKLACDNFNSTLLRDVTEIEYSTVLSLCNELLPGVGNALATNLINHSTGIISERVMPQLNILADIYSRLSVDTVSIAVREAFEQRYEGLDRIVPFLEFANPDFGPHTVIARATTKGSTSDSLYVMHAMLSALHRGDKQITILPDQLEAFFGALPSSDLLPSSVEIGVHIIAPTVEAVDQGDFIIVSSALQPSKSMWATLGRFFDSHFNEISEELCDPEAIEAELLYLPLRDEAVNVLPRRTSCEYQICIDGAFASRDRKTILLSDLFVKWEFDRLVLVSKSLGKRVRISQTSMMNTNIMAPQIVRTLMTISNYGIRNMYGFNWGELNFQGIFLPRLCIDKLVLCPSRWNLLKQDLIGAGGRKYFETFCSEWDVPEYVIVGFGDNRIPVNTRSDHGFHFIQDQAKTARGNVFQLEERLVSTAGSWLKSSSGTHAAELVVNFKRSHASVRKTLELETNDLNFTTEPRYGPGSEWFYAKLYAGPGRLDAVILKILDNVLIEDRDSFSLLFFLRYKDPESHVRLRVRAGSDLLRLRLEERLDQFLKVGTIDRLSYDTYSPETHRYGGIEGLALCEQFFMNDSLRAVESLRHTSDSRQNLISDAVLDFVSLFALFGDVQSADFMARYRPNNQSMPKDIWNRIRRDLVSSRGREVDEDFVNKLMSLFADGLLTKPIATIVRSLFHMRCNRVGLSSELEHLALALLCQSIHVRKVLKAESANGVG